MIVTDAQLEAGIKAELQWELHPTVCPSRFEAIYTAMHQAMDLCPYAEEIPPTVEEVERISAIIAFNRNKSSFEIAQIILNTIDRSLPIQALPIAGEDAVEAMKRELERQQVPFAPFPQVSKGAVVIYSAPAVDLELLARAVLNTIGLEALQRERDDLRKKVEIAATIFDEYERLHLLKGTIDGDQKAKRNAQYAAEMREPKP